LDITVDGNDLLQRVIASNKDVDLNSHGLGFVNAKVVGTTFVTSIPKNGAILIYD